MLSDPITKSQLRKQIRSARNALSNTQRTENELAIASALLQSTAVIKARHIAIYLASDGEPSLKHFFNGALSAGKSLYLPCVEDKTMVFRAYLPETTLQENRFGILEPPKAAKQISAQELDVVCVPLVAYDLEGGRLGMGGGFYDRFFAHKREDKEATPKLIGVAHSLQQVRRVPVDTLDVRVDSVVNENGLFTCSAINF